MPESRNTIHLFFPAIGLGRTAEQAVCLWEHHIQQRNQIVLQHSLYRGILLVLPVTVFLKQPSILLWGIPWQCKPVVKTVVGQLHSVFLVGLGPSQTVVPVVMHQHCIDYKDIKPYIVE